MDLAGLELVAPDLTWTFCFTALGHIPLNPAPDPHGWPCENGKVHVGGWTNLGRAVYFSGEIKAYIVLDF